MNFFDLFLTNSTSSDISDKERAIMKIIEDTLSHYSSSNVEKASGMPLTTFIGFFVPLGIIVAIIVLIVVLCSNRKTRRRKWEAERRRQMDELHRQQQIQMNNQYHTQARPWKQEEISQAKPEPSQVGNNRPLESNSLSQVTDNLPLELIPTEVEPAQQETVDRYDTTVVEPDAIYRARIEALLSKADKLYKPKSAFMNNIEQVSFFYCEGILRDIKDKMGKTYRLFPQVPLCEFVCCHSKEEIIAYTSGENPDFFDRDVYSAITSKRVDFLICERARAINSQGTSKFEYIPKVAIEVDGSGHRLSENWEFNDHFKETLLSEMDIKYFRVAIPDDRPDENTREELRGKIFEALGVEGNNVS